MAEFATYDLPGGKGPLLIQIMDALQDLKLRPLQLERIHRLFSRAVSRAARPEEPAPFSSTRVRIWLLQSCTGDCGWSFFLVETREHEHGHGAAAKPDHHIQLFLYQERDS